MTIEQLYHYYQDFLVERVTVLDKERGKAEDIVQQVFLKKLEKPIHIEGWKNEGQIPDSAAGVWSL